VRSDLLPNPISRTCIHHGLIDHNLARLEDRRLGPGRVLLRRGKKISGSHVSLERLLELGGVCGLEEL